MYRMIKTVVLFIMISPALSAQYRYHHPDIFIYPPVNYTAVSDDSEQSSEAVPSPWLRYSVDAGSWFSSMNGYNSFGTFLSPRMFIPAGSRMMIETGLTFVSAWMPSGGEGGASRYSDMIGYARGIFATGEKTTIYGEVAGSLTGTNPLSGAGESQILIPGGNFRSYTIGVEHFITPNLRIGASVTSTQGYDPRYPFSPYSRYRSDYLNPWYY
jgi:hypothetical protein